VGDPWLDVSRVAERVGMGGAVVAKNALNRLEGGDSKLPLVPDVAIHYRCGDNIVSHYGFLPFLSVMLLAVYIISSKLIYWNILRRY
jgi:hypothetical protein